MKFGDKSLDEERLGPLFRMAIVNGAETAVALQISRGANPNGCDDDGAPALVLAASKGHINVCNLLLRAGADPHRTGPDGLSAISIAKQRGLDLEFATAVTSGELIIASPAETRTHDQSALEDVYDLSGWIEEVPVVLPTKSFDFLRVDDLQRTITDHVIRNLDQNWDDIVFDLPQLSSTWRRWNNLSDKNLERIKNLFQEGAEAGSLTFEDIDRAMPPRAIYDIDSNFKRNLLACLEETGVLIEDSPWHFPRLEHTSIFNTKMADDGFAHFEYLTRTETDPLAILNDVIDSLPVLTRDEEDYLWKLRERGRQKIFSTCASSNTIQACLLSLIVDLESGNLVLSSWSANDLTDDTRLTNELDQENALPLAATKLSDILADTEPNEWPILLGQAGLSDTFLELLAQRIERISDDLSVSAVVGGLARSKRASERLFQGYLSLVISVAKRMTSDEFPITDAVQEGALGLLRAIERFDPLKGYRLFSYAVWWIRQFISRAIDNQARFVRVPVHVMASLRQIKTFQDEIGLTQKRLPDLTEIVDSTGIPAYRVVRVLALPPEPLGSLSHKEVLAIEAEDRSAEDAIQDLDVALLVQGLISKLDPRERLIITLRFGLNGSDEHTLEEVGQKFNVTRERIRQIEKKALIKLTRQVRSQRVKGMI